MLVLTREIGQTVEIMKNLVTVQVLEVLSDGRVKLGFTAPLEIDIVRSEAKKKTT